MASFLRPLLIALAEICGPWEFYAESGKENTHVETLNKTRKRRM